MKNKLLTDKEKKYLREIIKPFKDNVECVQKEYLDEHFRLIVIYLKDDKEFDLQPFNVYDMYCEMEDEKPYTLEELGL